MTVTPRCDYGLMAKSAPGKHPRELPPAEVPHSAGEYVRGIAHTNGIESLWSMFKRGYVGTYHHMSDAHLGQYVNEFAGRHHLREMGIPQQMATVVGDMVGKRLRYDDLVAVEPVGTVAEPDRSEPWQPA